MKPYLILSLLLSVAASAFGQEKREETAVDTVEKAKTSLNLATIYANNASYYGQTSAERLPYVLGNASLNFPGGFYLSAGAYKLLNLGSGISGVDLSAGYDFKLSKQLSGSASFSHSFFPDSSLLLQSTNPDMASASLSYDWDVITTGLTADYAIGDENALFATFNVSKSIDLGSLLSPKDYISFDPAVEVVGGTQHITTTEELPSQTTNGNGNGKKFLFLPLPSSSKTSAPQYRQVTSSSFDLLSYNIKLPISYNRANYAIEATYQGSVLGKKVDGYTNKLNSFFYLGFYYSF